MGCIFAPLVTTAMRNVKPQLAGAASGVLNTVRQVGLVIGTAAVGALLQNRLVSAMTSQANARTGALPPQVRSRFETQIHNSANNGIQVGAGQNGGSTHQIPGAPPGLVAELARIAHEIFTSAYVTAMRQTLIMPIILLPSARSAAWRSRTASPPGRQLRRRRRRRPPGLSRRATVPAPSAPSRTGSGAHLAAARGRSGRP